jgi:hypothetical protein
MKSNNIHVVLGFSEDFCEYNRFLLQGLKHKNCEANDGSDQQIDLLSPWEIWCNRLILGFLTDSELERDSKMNDTIQIPSFIWMPGARFRFPRKKWELLTTIHVL